jgi:molybdopterin biosynthesis enzyme
MIGNHTLHVTDVLGEVQAELCRAVTKFPRPQASVHEGYGVLAEEVHEFFLEVIGNRREAARKELIQVAAMAIRTIIEVSDKPR